MELINNLQHEPRQYQHSYFRSTIILLLVLLMVRARVTIGRAGLRAHGLSSFLPCSAARTAPQSVLLLEQRQKPDCQGRSVPITRIQGPPYAHTSLC